MPEQKVRIGFVGVGRMGQCAHLKNYANLDICQVVAIAEIRESLRQKVAVRYGVPNTYPTHEEMLRNETLDGIVAAQPFGRYGILVPQLLKAGVPVFTEKPLAASIEAGEKIVTAVKTSGTWHMIGYHKRSDPASMYAKAEIERLKASGELGKMTYVRILMPSGDWAASGFNDLIQDDSPPPALESDPPAVGMNDEVRSQYNGFVNYYIHQINLMRYLLGEPYAVTYADPSGVLLAGQSENGIACTIEMSPYSTTIDWQESVLVCFERGYVKIDLPAPLATNRPGRVEILRDPGEGTTPETVIPQLPAVHAMRQQAINFVTAIKGDADPPCTSEEGLEDLKVARTYIKLLTGV